MNEWIEWKGGECPVHENVDVEYQLKSGNVFQNKASTLYWGKSGSVCDIVAYRVAKPLSCEEAYDETTRGIRDDLPTSALNVQVDGNHYKQFEIQPVEFINANKMDFLQGSVVKYISRHKLKGKQKDVEKAIHFCKLILELQYGEGA